MIEAEPSGGGEDGHLRAAAVTDIYLFWGRISTFPVREAIRGEKAAFDFAAV